MSAAYGQIALKAVSIDRGVTYLPPEVLTRSLAWERGLTLRSAQPGTIAQVQMGPLAVGSGDQQVGQSGHSPAREPVGR
jgi:hypothetical protein